MRRLRWPILCLAALLAGCASAVESGHNTALSGLDLQKMTDRMAGSIAGDSAVQSAIASEGKLRVVVQPVQNEMEAEILPRGQAEAFTARVRYLLSKHAPDRFTWIMNRDAYYDLRGQELDVPLGPAPEAISPRYALVARFRSLSDESSQRPKQLLPLRVRTIGPANAIHPLERQIRSEEDSREGVPRLKADCSAAGEKMLRNGSGGCEHYCRKALVGRGFGWRWRVAGRWSAGCGARRGRWWRTPSRIMSSAITREPADLLQPVATQDQRRLRPEQLPSRIGRPGGIQLTDAAERISSAPTR